MARVCPQDLGRDYGADDRSDSEISDTYSRRKIFGIYEQYTDAKKDTGQTTGKRTGHYTERSEQNTKKHPLKYLLPDGSFACKKTI